MSRTLVTGASGLLGSALARRRPVLALPRRDPGDGGPWWEPDQGAVHDGGLRFDAVVHLAGAGVADQRWSAARKAEILGSRVKGTRGLVDWMAGLAPDARPRVLVAASAIGLYGDRADEELTEHSAPGRGFLAETCLAWEAESARAEALGVRTVILRIGVVLSPEGGALKRMLLPFQLGGGGPMGTGRQWFPWIHIEDLTGIVLEALDQPDMVGAYNAVAPGVLRQGDFARSLGKVLSRPAVLPAPALALELALGRELAREALLASARVKPARLLDRGFPFRFPELEPALRDLLSR